MTIYLPSTATLDRIVADLQTNQKPERVLHIFGVLQLSLVLGSIFKVDSRKLTLAALLHDCAKNIGRDETLELATRGHINLSEVDRNYPAIWHGPVAAYLAHTRYQIDDEEVLQAVEHHTLGTGAPSALLQILMCADFCEPTRQLPGIDVLRSLIRKDLRGGLLAILHLKVEDLIKKDQKPHPRIYSTIESLES